MHTQRSKDVLGFWFPTRPSSDQAAMVRPWEWWFRGGANTDITEHFSPLLERVARGELDAWSHEPQSRLALIIVLDQFSRTIYGGTAQAFAQDPKACALTLEGIDNRSQLQKLTDIRDLTGNSGSHHHRWAHQ